MQYQLELGLAGMYSNQCRTWMLDPLASIGDRR